MDNTEEEYLPFVMVKLLYAMTLNRNIKCVSFLPSRSRRAIADLRLPSCSSTNWLDNLRRQYLKRMPDETKLGTPEEPIEWAELGLGDKVSQTLRSSPILQLDQAESCVLVSSL
jgi:hypothetical protein